MTRVSDPRIRVKSVKAWAFYRAPFERFVYLDFDSRPCSWHAPSDVLAKLRESGRDALLPVWKSKFYGVFVLNRRVDLHAIDAMLARWRGDVGSSLLDGASTAASSPRNDLCTRHTG